MARNTISIDDVVNEFILLNDEDGYVSHATESVIRNFALRGIREIGFDLGKKIKSLKLPINNEVDTVKLPDDFVDFSKLGIVDEDGIIRPLVMNNNINYSRKETATTSTTNSATGPLDIEANFVQTFVD